LEALTDITQTFICDFLTAIIQESANLFEKSRLLSEVQADGLQGTESLKTFHEIFQTLVCDIFATIISELTN